MHSACHKKQVSLDECLKLAMTGLVSSGYLKSNTPRADRRQAAVVSCWDKGERESREKEEGGSEWMRKEEER